MNIVLLRIALSMPEINQLTREFPQYLFLSFPEKSLKNLPSDYWGRIEIFYGNKLTKEELARAAQLRWIHTTNANFNLLPLEEITDQGNILLTTSKLDNAFQIAEFVIGTALAFAKNLFQWKAANQFPQLLWDAKWRSTMMTLEKCVFVQVGMDAVGLEIAKKASENGMKVISVDKENTFHPYTEKNLSIRDLHSILPQADVVSVHLPRSRETVSWFGKKELKLMKEGAILIIRGYVELFGKDIDPEDFAKLRGALFDPPYQTPLPTTSKVWDIPNLIVTPDVASRPKSHEREAFRIFRYNLRQFIHSNFADMKNLVDTQVILINENEYI